MKRSNTNGDDRSDEKRKQTKAERIDEILRLSQADMAHELRKLVDSANAPIFGIDIHGRVNEW